MSKHRRLEYHEYIRDVVNKLESAGLNTDLIQEKVSRIDKWNNNIDMIFPHKGWRYLMQNFLPEIKRSDKNVYFDRILNSELDCSVLCIKNDDGTYNVAFSFINPKDDLDIDYRKYCVYNYFKEKYTYKNIQATSFINAIVIANNSHNADFPKNRRCKMIPYLALSENIKNYNYDCVTDFRINSKNCYTKYINLKTELMDKMHLTDKDIRYYSFETFSIMVLRKDDGTFDVTMSFINPKDYYSIYMLKNPGDYKHIYKTMLIENYLSKKYTYTCSDVSNSLNAAMHCWNKNRLEFPSYYHDCKMQTNVNCIKLY